ncbi:MAG: lipopolysaccharide biosynthesis protein, partial [Gammaproteobacteria bacterium]
MSEQSLKQRVLTALRWTALARFSAQVLNWVITLVVIRILVPEDYGLMAMSQILFTVLMGLSRVGMGAALVQASRISVDELRQVFGFLIALNLGLFSVQFVAAPWIAAAFAEPRLETLVKVIGLVFLMQPLIVIPSNMLGREIDFKRRSIVELIASATSALLVLGGALAGWGVWALMAGLLFRTLVEAVGMNVIHPFLALPDFRIGKIRHLISFGWVKTAENFAWKLFSQADIIIAGRVFGTEVLGIYTVALEIASLPMVKIMPLLQDVALSAYSRVKDSDRGAVKYYFLKSLRAVSFLSFPVFLGLASIAVPFVAVVLGEKWAGVGLPLMLMCLVMPFRMITNLASPVLSAVGRPGAAVRIMVAAILVMVPAFLLGAQGGVVGLAAAWLAAFPLVFLYAVAILAAILEVDMRALLKALAPSAATSVAMFAMVLLGARLGASLAAPQWLELI